jgi:acyl-[acyl-carrier-protein]-phospholipid O-acyltransferase/long-chain-fatty-acid--[acyl-carrier-protein] ligase
MILTVALLLGLVAAYLAIAGIEMGRLGLGFRQALFYIPFKFVYPIADRRIRIARQAQPPVIYAVVHQSRIDPALMLALLPQDTLHILDPDSASAAWLEPWRELARTIAFNAEHVFVSRRLVRHLRGKGRLAVYFPDSVEPDTKAFRLYRAVGRIAAKAEARIVPIFIGGARHLPFSSTPPELAPRRWFPRLRLGVLEPATLTELAERRGGQQSTMSNTLFDRVAEARIAGVDLTRGLFLALREAAFRFGIDRSPVEDVVSGRLDWRRLFIEARLLGHRFASTTAPGEAVGIMLPNSNALVVSLVGLFSGSRVAAIINHTAGPASVTSAVRTAVVRTVISSRAFVQKAGLAEIVQAAEQGGAKFIWLEDISAGATITEKLAATLLWRMPLARQDAELPAVILFTSGTEGLPKAVVLSHRNLLANAMQAEARIAISPTDTLLNVLPAFHSFGLTGGTLLPLLTGVRLFLYPSPLHYKLIPGVASRIKPTILFGTDTFLTGYARTAAEDDFSSLRLVVSGGEPVKAETRRVWRDRFGAEIVEGYGLTEAAPVVAVNSTLHNRDGTVGRLLPGMRLRLEPVEGIDGGGRLLISGPNVMMGYMTAERPGELQSSNVTGHDTGDIVSIDREGFITIKGRAKRFAKVAGEMVSLGAVEMLVQALWPEDMHAVVSVPDRRRGERIVLVTTADAAEPNALRRYVKQVGADAMLVPQDIVKVDAMPTLGTGKTDYAGTRRLVLERLGLNVAA